MTSSAGKRFAALIFATRAAEKAVPPQNEVVQTTLLGGTAHVNATIVYRSRFVARLPQPISHARRLSSSPSRSRCTPHNIELDSTSHTLHTVREILMLSL